MAERGNALVDYEMAGANVADHRLTVKKISFSARQPESGQQQKTRINMQLRHRAEPACKKTFATDGVARLIAELKPDVIVYLPARWLMTTSPSHLGSFRSTRSALNVRLNPSVRIPGIDCALSIHE